jgi:hypothetical protein
MIRTEAICANALKVTVPEKLKAEDVGEIAPQIGLTTS